MIKIILQESKTIDFFHLDGIRCMFKTYISKFSDDIKNDLINNKYIGYYKEDDYNITFMSKKFGLKTISIDDFNESVKKKFEEQTGFKFKEIFESPLNEKRETESTTNKLETEYDNDIEKWGWDKVVKKIRDNEINFIKLPKEIKWYKLTINSHDQIGILMSNAMIHPRKLFRLDLVKARFGKIKDEYKRINTFR